MFEEYQKTVLTVCILGKEYKISCSYNLQSSLLEAAKFLDKKMREIRDKHNVIGTDKIAVLAALHITHELLASNSKHERNNQELQQKIKLLTQKISESII